MASWYQLCVINKRRVDWGLRGWGWKCIEVVAEHGGICGETLHHVFLVVCLRGETDKTRFCACMRLRAL